ncbi:MAG TPA: PhzF family phenazine biosynthesis protein [Edaphobacter sp.]|nr:PhzF family phenazine biosynthesis protein [Edaphobacter sp.]
MNRRAFLASTGMALASSRARAAGRRADAGPSRKADLTNEAAGVDGAKTNPAEVPFYFVDVFAEQPLTGNPLSIVPDAHSLDEETMKRIAGELNQAETTFLLPSHNKTVDWRLRSFTAPGHEIFGAGHNSLGAWWWLAESGTLKLREGSNHFTQQIGDRLLPVEVRCEGGRLVAVVLTQSPPVFGEVLKDTGELAASLGIETDDLDVERLPTQVISTGAGHLLVPVRSRAVIERLRPDSQRLAKVLKAAGGEGCYVYSRDTVLPGSSAHARFFNPTMGIVEDAATGTAAGPLACQLVRHGIAKEGVALTIEQGYEMKRPSLLRLEVQGQTVKLAGRCVQVIEGKIRIRLDKNSVWGVMQSTG